jgi:hypothetical protein
MGYGLRSGLSYCMVDDHVVFLDLPADRYFQLSAGPEEAFKRMCLEPKIAPSDLALLTRPGLVEEQAGHDGLLPHYALTATKSSSAMAWDRPAVSHALAALFVQSRVEKSLKARGLARTIARLSKLKRCLPIIAKGGGVRENWIRGFEQSKLLRSPVNRCLPRSMALASRLYKAGFGVQLVMGVRLRPFAAHCWVQDEDAVLNDTAEGVATFTPIFVL